MNLRSHISCSWECRKVWGNKPPHSQVSSHFGNLSLDRLSNLQIAIEGVKTHWIEKFLIPLKKFRTKLYKLGSHIPFEYLKHKLWPKEGQESNCQFDSQPLKVRNRPDWLACRWCDIYHWKDLDKGYNFGLDLTSIRGLHKTLWASKVVIVSI